jgi:hypothetical protein
MPEQNAKKDVLIAAGLGALGDIPGLGGPVAAIQAALQAASRARDEEWWAMALARLASVEKTVDGVVNFDDPEFLASAHRFVRAAQETADNGKRERLAAALSHSGPWSDLEPDYRVRMERLVVDLSTREVNLLQILSNPRGWLEERDPEAVKAYDTQIAGSSFDFIDRYIAGGDLGETAAVRASIDELERRALLGINRGMITGSGILTNKVTGPGWEFLHYLQAIGID